jgi:hypothetical protein
LRAADFLHDPAAVLGRPRLLIGARFKVVKEIELHKIDQAHGDLEIHSPNSGRGAGGAGKVSSVPSSTRPDGVTTRPGGVAAAAAKSESSAITDIPQYPDQVD